MIPTILHSEKGKTLETKVIYSHQGRDGWARRTQRVLGAVKLFYKIQWWIHVIIQCSVRYNGGYMSLYSAITHRMYNTKSEPKCWLWTLSDYVVFIKCTTWTTQVGDLDNSCVETGCMWEVSALSAQLCCELKTALKNQVY